MAAPPINPQLLIQGFLRQARTQPDPTAWLHERHAAALAAVAGGDEFIASTSSAEGGHTAERGIPAATLLEIYEACLQILEAESNAALGIYAAPGSVRHADFSSYPSTLG